MTKGIKDILIIDKDAYSKEEAYRLIKNRTGRDKLVAQGTFEGYVSLDGRKKFTYDEIEFLALTRTGKMSKSTKTILVDGKEYTLDDSYHIMDIPDQVGLESYKHKLRKLRQEGQHSFALTEILELKTPGKSTKRFNFKKLKNVSLKRIFDVYINPKAITYNTFWYYVKKANGDINKAINTEILKKNPDESFAIKSMPDVNKHPNQEGIIRNTFLFKPTSASL